jgi:flagellar basal-body rod modification protein FlgD
MALDLDSYFGISTKALSEKDQIANNVTNANSFNYKTQDIDFNEYLAESMVQSNPQLATSLQSNQALHASALVGRTVLIESNRVYLGTEGATNIFVDLVDELCNLTASIYADSGELLKFMPLNQANPGMFQFSWDGNGEVGERLAAGKYQVKVLGIYGGKEVVVKTLINANVDSVTVSQNGDGLRLNVAGIGPVGLNEVRHISV